MTDTDFRELVKKMRRLQKEYFRSRSGSILNECKDAERRVDKALEPEVPQLDFGGEG